MNEDREEEEEEDADEEEEEEEDLEVPTVGLQSHFAAAEEENRC